MKKSILNDLQDQKGLQDSLINDSPSWPASNEFPIIAFNPMPWDYPWGKTDKEISTVRSLIKSVADCGIDTVKTEGGIVTQKTFLNAAIDFGISIIPINSDLGSPKLCLDLFKNLRTHQNLAAWQIMDEPHPYDWGGIFDSNDNIAYPETTVWNRLTVGYNLINALDPSRIAMFTLAVSTNPVVIGKFGSDNDHVDSIYNQYMPYLQHLDTLYHPKVWSFDYYPVACKLKPDVYQKHKHDPGFKPTDSQLDTYVWYGGLFPYLRCFQDITQETGSKYLAYTNCMNYNLYDDPTVSYPGPETPFRTQYPIPTIGKLRLEIFSAMCFGASGIVYYRYGLGPELPRFICFESAVSYKNQTIVKSPTIWPLIKSMNEQVRLWQNMFIGCTVGIHRHSFNGLEAGIPSAVDVGVEKLTDIDILNTCITRLVCLSNPETGNEDKGNANYGTDTGSYRTTAYQQPGVLLSWFTNPGYADGHEHYIAILNLDIARPQKLLLVLNKGGYYFLKETKNCDKSTYSLCSTVPSPNTAHYITLSPGEMIVLFW